MNNKNLHSDYLGKFSHHLQQVLLDGNNRDSNHVISPSRLQAVLVLLANWASASIKKEILARVGNGSLSLEEANMLTSRKCLFLTPDDWCDKMAKEKAIPIIEQQALMWVKKELEVNRDAVAKIAEDFDITLHSVDFSDKDLKSIMDAAISEATHGQIKELDLQLTKETMAVISDILYFRASWDSPFEEYDTKEQIFYGTKGKSKVPMMKMTDHWDYRETKTFQMVSLDYRCWAKEKRNFAMRVYIPKTKCSLCDMLNEIGNVEGELCVERQEVKLSLPRFTVEETIDLKEILPELGLGFIFESDDITPGCIKDLKIQQFITPVRDKIAISCM